MAARTRSRNPKDVALGARIRLLRLQKGVSLERLAAGCEGGLSLQQMQKYEQGTNRITYSRLTEIAATLGISATELIAPLDIAGEDLFGVADYIAMLQTPGALDILSAFYRLPVSKQRKVRDAIITLLTAEK